MRIVCPSCAARYEIADGMLARPRTVRCSRCGREWEQDPVPPAPSEAAAERVVEPAPPPPDPIGELQAHAAQPALVPFPRFEPGPPAAAGPPVQQAGRAGPRLAWIASIVLLAALALAAYRFRDEIQQAWPPSARLFRLLAA